MTEFTLLKARKWRWEPKSDITAYQLAYALPVILCGSNAAFDARSVEQMLLALPDEVQRHFKEKE